MFLIIWNNNPGMDSKFCAPTSNDPAVGVQNLEPQQRKES
jgi:hypothetical protein